MESNCQSVNSSAKKLDACELTSTECAQAKRTSRLRFIAWLLVSASALFLVGYLYRAPLLSGMARAWVVNEPTTHADAIVILGGGLESRPFAAAKLFHANVASRILYMDVRRSPSEEMGITLPEVEQTRRILLSNGVPETAMTVVGSKVTSTFDEARAVKGWVEKNGAQSIIIPTDAFHTRRARWIFRKELRVAKAEIHVVPIDPIRYKLSDWWTHEEGLIFFQNEVVKSLYYRLHY